VPYTPPATSQPPQSAPPQGQPYGAQPQGQPQGQPYGAQPQSQGQYGAQQQGQYPPPQGQYGPPQDTGPSRRAFTLNRIQVEAGVRFGSEGLAFGVGGRAGYTLDFGLYFGGLFDYWFGESEEVGFTPADTISTDYSAWDLVGEVGYDFGVLPMLVIRPFGGFGVIHANLETCFPGGPCIKASGSDAIGELAGAVIVSLDGLHLGGEFRMMFSGNVAVVAGANIGGDF
jgi:hypothetical protein